MAHAEPVDSTEPQPEVVFLDAAALAQREVVWLPPAKNAVTPSSHESYRPDVDGLRAVAVVAVIIFHLDAKLLPGGFVGVDIFFVIFECC